MSNGSPPVLRGEFARWKDIPDKLDPFAGFECDVRGIDAVFHETGRVALQERAVIAPDVERRARMALSVSDVACAAMPWRCERIVLLVPDRYQ